MPENKPRKTLAELREDAVQRLNAHAVRLTREIRGGTHRHERGDALAPHSAAAEAACRLVSETLHDARRRIARSADGTAIEAAVAAAETVFRTLRPTGAPVWDTSALTPAGAGYEHVWTGEPLTLTATSVDPETLDDRHLALERSVYGKPLHLGDDSSSTASPTRPCAEP